MFIDILMLVGCEYFFMLFLCKMLFIFRSVVKDMGIEDVFIDLFYFYCDYENFDF